MSSPSRLETLQAMAEKRPGDPMVHYGLGLEYRKAGAPESAATAFRTVARLDPANTAAFQELGSVLVQLGRPEEARAAFVEGIEAAGRVGATRARDHIRRLLEALGPAPAGSSGPFCS